MDVTHVHVWTVDWRCRTCGATVAGLAMTDVNLTDDQTNVGRVTA